MAQITDVAIPNNCGDYRLMDKVVVKAILDFPERNRFMKGIMAAAGFKAATVEYDRPEREAGTTKFNFWKLWNFALDGITSFSTVPLRVWSYLGAFIALCSFSYAGWIVIKIAYWRTAPDRKRRPKNGPHHAPRANLANPNQNLGFARC